MIDPMADLDGAAAAKDGEHGSGMDVIDFMRMSLNLQRVDHVRSVMSIAGGCVAGILGLTGWKGLILFVLLHTMVLVTVWIVHMHGGALKSYTRQSWFGYLTTNLQPSALSFTLFWTLLYGLVYLY